MEKIYRAAKYIRTSCPDDETQYSDSVANQRRLIDAFVETYSEIIVVSERIDEGYSGLLSERPAFQKLLADVEAGIVNCIIVKDLSRWSRDYIETGQYLRDYFPVYGVRFISIDDNIDTIKLDGFDKAIVLLKSIFSEHYSRDVSIKTRSALETKRRQGKYVGAIPIYGFQRSSEDKYRLIPDPNTVGVVQSIFRMKLCGHSAASIAAELNRLNISSPLSYKRECGLPHPVGGFADKSNAQWSATTILRILQDENYTGTLVQGRQHSISYKTRTFMNLDESEWTKAKNAHPAIVYRADYEAVQRTLAMDTRTAPRNAKLHIFSGVMICGCCNDNMVRKTTKHNEQRYIYYRCRSGKINGCHSPSTINEDNLLSIVTDIVLERIADIERLCSCLSEMQIDKLLQSERNQQIAAYVMKIRNLLKYRTNLHNGRTEGLLNDIEYQEHHDYYDREIAFLESELSALRKSSRFTDATVRDFLEWTQSYLQFSGIKELDRLTIVKTIRSIHVLATKEIAINFTYQAEYEQLLRFAKLGGYINGAEESQTE